MKKGGQNIIFLFIGFILLIALVIGISEIVFAQSNIKWNPGHYLSVYRNYLDFDSSPPTGISTKIKGDSNFKGVLQQWEWNDLETSKGVYDFSPIFNHLNEYRKWNPQPILVFKIRYSTWSETNPAAMVPNYVAFSSPSGVIVSTEPGLERVVLALWRSNGLDPLKNLLTAMSQAKNPQTGQTLDEDPLFGGIVFPESALGLFPPIPEDLSPTGIQPPEAHNYIAALKELALHAKTVFPHTPIIQNTNFLQGRKDYMEHYLFWARDNGIMISGPDMSREGAETTAGRIILENKLSQDAMIAFETQIGGKMKDMLCVGLTVKDIFEWVIENPNGFRLNYVFWNHRDDVIHCGNRWSWDNSGLPDDRRIKKVVASKMAKINEEIPAGYGNPPPTPPSGSPPPPFIESITWDTSTFRHEAPGSDNWPMTWADDGYLYTSWGDGGGFGGTNSDGRVSLGVARVEGLATSYQGFNVWGGKKPGKPCYFWREIIWNNLNRRYPVYVGQPRFRCYGL